MLDLSSLKGALERLETRPVSLPWTYVEDGIEHRIELDLPRIDAAPWTTTLKKLKISTVSVSTRVGIRAQGQTLRAALRMGEANGGELLIKAFSESSTDVEAVAREEGISNPEEPALFRADVMKLCDNGKKPAPILSIITSGRLVPIKRQETEITKVRALLPAGENAPLVKDEAVDITEDAQPQELDAELLAPLFEARTLCLPSTVYGQPPELAHVAIVRFLLVEASNHAQYESRTADAKKKLDNGGTGEKKPSANKRPRKRTRSNGARSK